MADFNPERITEAIFTDLSKFIECECAGRKKNVSTSILLLLLVHGSKSTSVGNRFRPNDFPFPLNMSAPHRVQLLLIFLVAINIIIQAELTCNSETASYIDVNYARDHCGDCSSAQKKLTVLILYYNECALLRHQAALWKQMDPSLFHNVSFLLVDDYSAISATSCLSPELDPGIKFLRVGKNLDWNIGGGRNLGMYYSCSPYILSIDIDTLMTENVLRKSLQLIDKDLIQNKLLLLNRHMVYRQKLVNHPHPGCFLTKRESYWRCGGCDEDFVGILHYFVIHFY